MTNTRTSDLIGSDELASKLDVNRRTIYRWAAAGRITPAATFPGGTYRWRLADVLAELGEVTP